MSPSVVLTIDAKTLDDLEQAHQIELAKKNGRGKNKYNRRGNEKMTEWCRFCSMTFKYHDALVRHERNAHDHFRLTKQQERKLKATRLPVMSAQCPVHEMHYMCPVCKKGMGEIRRPMYDNIVKKHLKEHGIGFSEARVLQTFYQMPPMVQPPPVYWNPTHDKAVNYHEQPTIEGMEARHEPSPMHIDKDGKVQYGVMPKPYRLPGAGNRPLDLTEIPDSILYCKTVKKIQRVYELRLERNRKETIKIKEQAMNILKKVETYKKKQESQKTTTAAKAQGDDTQRLTHDRDSYQEMYRKRRAAYMLRKAEAKNAKTGR
jgi:hypothetical protein